MIKYENFMAYVEDTKESESPEAFLADYGCPADCPYGADNLKTFCAAIWAAAHTDVELLAEIGTKGNRSALSRKYNIPRRTLQNWALEDRKANSYVVELIAYAMIAEIPEISEKER